MNLCMITSAMYYLVQHITTTDSCYSVLYHLSLLQICYYAHETNCPEGEVPGVQRSPS